MTELTNPVIVKRIYEYAELTGTADDFEFLLDKNGEATAVKMSIATLFGLINHNQLAGLQGGGEDDYQHLTTSQLDRVNDPVWTLLSNTTYTQNPITTNQLTVSSTVKNFIKPGYGIKFKQNFAVWEASTSYAFGDIIFPTTETGFAYQCTTAGDSDSTEPTWDTEIKGTTTDNTAEWTTIEMFNYGIVYSINNTDMLIYGCPFSENVTEIYYCDQQNILPTTFGLTDGTFAQIGTDVLTDYENNMPIENMNCILIFTRIWAKTADTGINKSKIDVKNGANSVYNLTDGIELSSDETFNVSGTSLIQAYSYFDFLQDTRIDITDPGDELDTTGARVTNFYIYR